MATRLPDPFTHPGLIPGFTSAPLVDNEPLIQDALPNGRVLEVSTSTQFWSINISYPELYEEEFRILNSTINKAKSTDGVLLVALPQYLNLRVFGDLTQTTIAAGQKGSSITIGNTANISGRPYVGDLFQLSTHNKVYKITSVDIFGDTMVLGVYPKLAITTTGLEKPKFNDILFHMKLIDRTSFTENLNPDGMYTDVSIQLREAL